MADETATSRPDYLPANVLDAVFLRDTHEKLGETLRRAKHEVSYFRREICALVTEPELPAGFRAAYQQVVLVLAAVEQAIIIGEQECGALGEEFRSAGLFRWGKSELNSSPVSVQAAMDVIQQINEAETHVIKVVKSAN